jgi:zinc transporter ZupT
MSTDSKNSVWSAGLTYGAILGAVSVIISVIFYVLGKTFSDLERYLNLVVLAGMMIYFLYL